MPCLALLACLTPPVAGGVVGWGPAWGRDDGVLVCCCCSQFWSPLRRAGRAMCVSRVRVPVLPPVYFAFPAGSWSGLAPRLNTAKCRVVHKYSAVLSRLLLSGGDRLQPVAFAFHVERAAGAPCVRVACRAGLRRRKMAGGLRIGPRLVRVRSKRLERPQNMCSPLLLCLCFFVSGLLLCLVYLRLRSLRRRGRDYGSV